MWGVCKPLMDEQLRVAASTIEDLKLFSFLYIVGGITLTGAGIYVKVGSHLCEGVVAHVPEGDKGHGGLFAVLERNIILTRHHRRYCPHKVIIVEPYCIKGEADVSMHLEGGEGEEGREERGEERRRGERRGGRRGRGVERKEGETYFTSLSQALSSNTWL